MGCLIRQLLKEISRLVGPVAIEDRLKRLGDAPVAGLAHRFLNHRIRKRQIVHVDGRLVPDALAAYAVATTKTRPSGGSSLGPTFRTTGILVPHSSRDPAGIVAMLEVPSVLVSTSTSVSSTPARSRSTASSTGSAPSRATQSTYVVAELVMSRTYEVEPHPRHLGTHD